MKEFAIIHITDTHFTPLQKIPNSALDNYHFIVKQEFEELKNEISKLKNNYKEIIICISGDLFNLKTQSLYFPKVINYYSKLIEDTFDDLTVYTIAGNHDLELSSMDLYESSAYNIWVKATKNVIDVSNKTVVLENGVTISGIPYYHLDEVKNRIKSVKLTKENTNVILLHSDIFKDASEVDWYLEKFITFEEVTELNRNFDLCLMGHIHKEMPITKITKDKDIWFSKPHAFSRMSKEYLKKESLMDAYPTYSLIEFENKDSVLKVSNMSFHRIKKFRSEEFLDFNELEKAKERGDKFDDFVRQLQEEFGTIEDSFKIEDADIVYKNTSIGKEVRDVVDKYFSK